MRATSAPAAARASVAVDGVPPVKMGGTLSNLGSNIASLTPTSLKGLVKTAGLPLEVDDTFSSNDLHEPKKVSVRHPLPSREHPSSVPPGRRRLTRKPTCYTHDRGLPRACVSASQCLQWAMRRVSHISALMRS